MAEAIAFAVGLGLGFALACLWMRRTVRLWGKAYELATADMAARYARGVMGKEGEKR